MYGRFLRPVYILIFEKILGWKISGKKPTLKKYVIIVAPHTSNWDFMIGLWARSSLRLKSWFIGKKELFIFPFGYLFRCLGGYPVDRSKGSNVVSKIVEIFNTKNDFVLAISPEGTRKYTAQWKTGFYTIATLAKVPIVMAAIDFSSKTLIIAEPFYPTENLDDDLIKIKTFFKQYKGKYPEKGII
ncbi:MAG: lysophospholipid acyltransferase family protein [Bacteroidetes bacterium]|nr:lysophospholipid acyltransferase family protein [Bacteroidota bacterium]